MAASQYRRNGTALMSPVRQCRATASAPTMRTAGVGTRPANSGHTHVATVARSTSGPWPRQIRSACASGISWATRQIRRPSSFISGRTIPSCQPSCLAAETASWSTLAGSSTGGTSGDGAAVKLSETVVRPGMPVTNPTLSATAAPIGSAIPCHAQRFRYMSGVPASPPPPRDETGPAATDGAERSVTGRRPVLGLLPGSAAVWVSPEPEGSTEGNNQNMQPTNCTHPTQPAKIHNPNTPTRTKQNQPPPPAGVPWRTRGTTHAQEKSPKTGQRDRPTVTKRSPTATTGHNRANDHGPPPDPPQGRGTEATINPKPQNTATHGQHMATCCRDTATHGRDMATCAGPKARPGPSPR